MPDTFFTASPHWAWYITAYFFIGGIAGGAFFLACILHLFGRPGDRPVVRLGYQIALAGALISGVLLTLDLKRPERFWHMLVQANTGLPMWKPWSPMSIGSWGVFLFSTFAFLGTVGALAEEGRLRWKPARTLSNGVPGVVIAVLGAFLGFFLAGYTGVLVSVTNRPLWADSSWLGVLFLASAASSGAAFLLLVARWRGGSPDSIEWLTRFDRQALVAELLILVAFVVSLGSVARVLLGPWGLLLVIGVVGAGIVAPLILEGRAHGSGHRHLVTAALLVLAGSLLLRLIVIFSSEQIHVAGSGVFVP